MLLRTFAIGLAAVWLVGGLDIAWRDKSVDLPTASKDVFYTFPIESKDISPFGSSSGGRLCDWPPFPNTKAKLIQVASKRRDILRFKFTNSTACDIYLLYNRDEPNSKDVFYPYWMECADRSGRMHQVVERDFFPAMNVLASDDYFFFDADRPRSKGPCKIGVGYHRDPSAYELFKTGAWFSDLGREDQTLIEKSLQSVELTFRP